MPSSASTLTTVTDCCMALVTVCWGSYKQFKMQLLGWWRTHKSSTTSLRCSATFIGCQFTRGSSTTFHVTFCTVSLCIGALQIQDQSPQFTVEDDQSKNNSRVFSQERADVARRDWSITTRLDYAWQPFSDLRRATMYILHLAQKTDGENYKVILFLQFGTIILIRITDIEAVSYTHLTLPTIYSV